MEGKKRERIPVKTLEQVAKFELWNIDDLPDEERVAVLDAIEAYNLSDNPEFRAGAAAVAENGDKAVRHNEKAGPEGHAEMLAVMALFRAVEPSERKLKLLALAASAPDEALVRIHDAYGEDITINDIEGERVCGRCLKFLSDYTGNFISSETGKNENESDVTILNVAATGQVIKTSLRSLHPMPHRPRRIPLKPIEQSSTATPDTYGSSAK